MIKVEYPIIGMSPGNSYFTDKAVFELIRDVVGKYGQCAILIADVPAISTYVALGYPQNRARRDKAFPKSNALKNKAERAISALGYDSEQVHIINWAAEVEKNPTYLGKYKGVQGLYKSSTAFKEAADNTTLAVLKTNRKNFEFTQAQIETAVHYLLSEIAFMEFAPIKFQASKVIYVYHKPWLVYDQYRRGEFDGIIKPYLDSDIISI